MELPLQEKQVLLKEGVTAAEDRLDNVTEGRKLSPVGITRILLFIVFLLLMCHLLVVHLGYELLLSFEHTSGFTIYEKVYFIFYDQFHLALEGNISTYFSATILAFASVLLYVIHSTGKGGSLHWLYLSIFFLFLSVDESAQIHETFGGIAGNKVNSYMGEVPSFLKWAWMIPYGALTLGIGLYFLRFTLQLPSSTRNLFCLSGLVYVFAALVLEFFESHFDTLYGPDNLINSLLFPLEEVLEMVGVIIFIYALLGYIKMKRKVLQFSFTDSN